MLLTALFPNWFEKVTVRDQVRLSIVSLLGVFLITAIFILTNPGLSYSTAALAFMVINSVIHPLFMAITIPSIRNDKKQALKHSVA